MRKIVKRYVDSSISKKKNKKDIEKTLKKNVSKKEFQKASRYINKLGSHSSKSSTDLIRHKKIILISSLIFILFVFFIYASFIYSKNCPNQTCLKEMVYSCNRAHFVSEGLIPLNNQILGDGFGGCIVKVSSLENSLGIPEGLEMICLIPKDSKVLPQSKLDSCTGELREHIQEKIISELYKTIGQNIGELSSAFKVN